MTRRSLVLKLGLVSALTLVVGANRASADVYDLNYDHATGETGPVSPPFGTVTLTLSGTTQVTLVYQADTSRITGFHEIAFNYAASGGSTIGSIVVSSDAASNAFPQEASPGAPGGGMGTYSYVYGENGGGDANQAQTVTVTITGNNLSLSNFELLSTLPPGDTPAYFAASFARTEDSKVVTGVVGAVGVSTPEPATFAIAGLGALGFLGYGLRRRAK